MNTDHDLKDSVRQGYGTVAKAGLSSEHAGMRSIAQAFGYSEEELASIPAASNMGLSCGNPTALASLRPGETVVDLGSGGGLDVFLAAKQVGPTGTAIGIDMTPEMISLARRNAESGGYDNVRFHLAELEAMPLPDASVDCVISNCVLNLCPDKDAVLREVARILKPGGRLAVSDIALKKPLPPQVEREVAAWTGCIAGAMTIADNESKLHAAGFTDVLVQDAGSDLNAYRDGGHAACCGPESDASMAPTESAGGCGSAEPTPAPAATSESSSCCGPSAEPTSEPQAANTSGSDFHATMDELLDTFDVNEFAASVKIYAVKPGG
ncbi:Ubiquinone/menaquinone biosynthesis C-methyltransferase UbiE [Planctomycetes bacterium Pla163]|uniref:Arsenite methyltransferase n=1 Tax=Rohdeia mirabilis TaxID=2528008 RepID=A0A518CX08_9BACT|nr:Ubiquinone/menaquinone biosynthesis C-methyltransferase UbiE [Planctomycetes bacterium Pla163]